MNQIAEVGMRIHVYSANQKEYLGMGTIEVIEPLKIEEPGLTIADTYPSRIVLDSGVVTNGLHCWWMAIDVAKEIEGEK